MISLTCTHCKAVLTIDDAFAGGACRCQHCGTIQTVPAKLKGTAKSTPIKGKTLYRNKARDGSGTGLDDLADAVLSSGLASARLRRRAPARARFLAIFFGTILLVVVLAATVVYLALRGKPINPANAGTSIQNPPGPAGSSIPEGLAPAPTNLKSPNFCAIPLDGQTIIYVLDRGDSTRDVFGDLKQACYRSIATLGKQRKFQVIFWNNGSDDSFPTGSPTYATTDNIDAATRTLDDIAAHGKTDIAPAFTKAVAGNPSTIIIATAKAWDLDDNFVTMIQNLRGACPAKVHTIAIGDPGSSTALKRIAANTGGVARTVTEGELKDFGQ